MIILYTGLTEYLAYQMFAGQFHYSLSFVIHGTTDPASWSIQHELALGPPEGIRVGALGTERYLVTQCGYRRDAHRHHSELFRVELQHQLRVTEIPC